MENARALTLRLQDLLRREHDALAEFLLALAAFDRRRAWAELGHASLFAFLHRDLRLSKGAAFYRATAAGLVQRFPDVVAPIRQGELCLTTVAEVARVLTPENVGEVLPQFFGLSHREAQALAAELQPREAPPIRDVVTVSRRAAAAPAFALACPTEPDLGQKVSRETSAPAASASLGDRRDQPATAAAVPPPTPAPRPEAVEPLTAELTRIHVTLPRRVLDKVEAARAALSHSQPGAGLAEIIEAGIDLLLERHAKRKGLVRPRSEPRPSADPEHVPAHVRREVWKRDGGRCQHPVASGGSCGSTLRVELHHVTSRHRGGPTAAENLTTLCGFHHDAETRREFGDALVDEIRRNNRRRAVADGTPRTAPP
jgi:hypothetical protein